MKKYDFNQFRRLEATANGGNKMLWDFSAAQAGDIIIFPNRFSVRELFPVLYLPELMRRAREIGCGPTVFRKICPALAGSHRVTEEIWVVMSNSVHPPVCSGEECVFMFEDQYTPGPPPVVYPREFMTEAPHSPNTEE